VQFGASSRPLPAIRCPPGKNSEGEHRDETARRARETWRAGCARTSRQSGPHRSPRHDRVEGQDRIKGQDGVEGADRVEGPYRVQGSDWIDGKAGRSGRPRIVTSPDDSEHRAFESSQTDREHLPRARDPDEAHGAGPGRARRSARPAVAAAELLPCDGGFRRGFGREFDDEDAAFPATLLSMMWPPSARTAFLATTNSNNLERAVFRCARDRWPERPLYRIKRSCAVRRERPTDAPAQMRNVRSR
jgi:hypothetical protein